MLFAPTELKDHRERLAMIDYLFVSFIVGFMTQIMVPFPSFGVLANSIYFGTKITLWTMELLPTSSIFYFDPFQLIYIIFIFK